MNTQEHLAAIVRHIDNLLAIAEKRTAGEWNPADEDFPLVYIPLPNAGLNAVSVLFEADWGTLEDASFIASCADNAEAGWRATKAAIEGVLAARSEAYQSWVYISSELRVRAGTEEEYGFPSHLTQVVNAILAAWPIELLNKKNDPRI